jgi:hypothetical protein
MCGIHIASANGLILLLGGMTAVSVTGTVLNLIRLGRRAYRRELAAAADAARRRLAARDQSAA